MGDQVPGLVVGAAWVGAGVVVAGLAGAAAAVAWK